ncbi:Gfo/Idh/MocA family protein [Marinicrinis sediminis]|uniref:Gfo/Idh/MocA family protein n=1 Tax=Marinicrinis sediminis TaxID=1652465 RepID=A0ABW5RBZ3_9BACL
MTSHVRWGILSAANIAVKSFLPAVKQSETAVVVAVASRNEEKARSFADEHGIERAYGSYEQLLQDPDIDAVYIPLPNHLHAEWTIRAAQAGKHVLCEKPLAISEEEAARAVTACKKEGVQLTEAFMYRHHPRYDQIKACIAAGEIGDIRGLYANFTFDKHTDTDNVRFQKKMGGGSLYDVGCYPISAARYVLEREPEAVAVQAFFSEDHDDVDMMASGLIEFPNQVGLTFQCGMWAERRNNLLIIGSEGSIEVPSAFIYDPDNRHFYVSVKGERREVEVPEVNHYTLQLDDFGRSILEGRSPRFPAEDSLLNMRVIEACLRSARNRERIHL